MSGCCDEWNCKRKRPYLIRRGPFSGQVFLISRFSDSHSGHITAQEKHDITAEFEAFCQNEGYVRHE